MTPGVPAPRRRFLGSSVNREQLRDANSIMGEVVPAIIAFLLDNMHRHWGDACYPVR